MQNIKQIDPYTFTNCQKQKINLLYAVVKDTTLMTEVKLKHYREDIRTHGSKGEKGLENQHYNTQAQGIQLIYYYTISNDSVLLI